MQFEELFPNWEEQILSNGRQLAESLELSQLEVMQLFWEHYLDGLSDAEIAREVGCSSTVVKRWRLGLGLEVSRKRRFFRTEDGKRVREVIKKEEFPRFTKEELLEMSRWPEPNCQYDVFSARWCLDCGGEEWQPGICGFCGGSNLINGEIVVEKALEGGILQKKEVIAKCQIMESSISTGMQMEH